MKSNLNKMLVLVTTEFDGIFDKGGTPKDINRIEKYHEMYLQLKDLV